MSWYETEADRERQREIAALVGAQHNQSFVETPPGHDVDFKGFHIGTWERATALEVKDRSVGGYSSRSFECLLIDVDKVERGMRFATRWEVAYWLAVRFTDGVKVLRGTFAAMERWQRGVNPERKITRHDPLDRDLCFYIPVSEFTV